MERFDNYKKAFLKQNAKLNLISKNDEKLLEEKHIFDSLAIDMFFEKYPNHGNTLLDIGTGGGFPSVPIAITHPEINVYALDSIRKKINAIEEMKAELDLTNLFTICDRAENLKDKYDIITTRAVAPLKVICQYALPLLKPNGFFIAYKSKKAVDEIKEINTKRIKIIDIIEYKLPLTEVYERNLIVVQGK